MIYCRTFQELLEAVKANVETELGFEIFNLNLNENNFKILAEALKSNTSLLKLLLNFKSISDVGVQY